MAPTAYSAVLVLVCCCALPAVIATTGLTDEEKTEVLRAHNYFRGMVQPIATDMERMEWDEELAYLAQFWSGQCEFMENENRNSQSGTFQSVGQSMAATASYTVNYTVLMQNTWYAEGRFFDYYGGTCSDEDGNQGEDLEGCEGYAQLVWARTYAVGCGAFRCDELAGAEDVDEGGLFFVCYYGPSANILYPGQPYQTGGEVCASCPSTKPYCVGNLCSSESGAPPMVTQISFFTILLVLLGAASVM